MKRVQLVMIALLLLSTTPIGKSNAANSLQGSASHVIRLNIVFVGFAQEVVNTSLIDSNIQKSYSFDYPNYTISYSFNVSYCFANFSYYLALRAFVLANSVNGSDITSRLNATALQTQRATGTKMSVFLPQSGRAINATAVEDWFEINPCISTPNPSYCFYILNFTEFDKADHGLEHWYNTTEMDLEASNMRDFWRLEWDNALNPNVKFPYAAFTSQSRVLFIDPSAFQWYLTWARIWWGLSVSGPKYDYYYEDLDQFLATHDVNTPIGKTALAYYLAGWIDDPLKNLLEPELYAEASTFFAKSISVQALILNNASQSGYSNEVMNWIINSTRAKESIEDLAPFIDVNVTVRFVNLADYPELEAIFDNAVLSQQDGRTVYDGGLVFNNLYNVRESYFNFSAADVVVNGYVLLESNMSMFVYGNEYTGLGGEGQILVMKSVERYFKEDSATRKSGLGLTFIHEAGHNLGFPHTFVNGKTHVGDFAFDVMGYYPYSYFFSQFRKDCFRRLVDDYRILNLEDTLEEDLLLYSSKPPTTAIDAKFDETHAKIDEIKHLYDLMQYLDAYDKLTEAENLERELEEMIWVYIIGTVHIRTDGSIDPSTTSIQTLDNATYTFTGNVTNFIVVERDNIVVDGANYMLQANRSRIGVGIDLSSRHNVTVKNIRIKEFRYGIYLNDSSNNRIYHNGFVNNTNQVYVNGSANFWDDGYPSGGNYWNDYAGLDLYGGPYQNETGADEIGDVPYIVGTSDQDHYPLIRSLGELIGDVNGDGYVGIDDIFAVALHFGQEQRDSGYSRIFDIICDGYIGIDDIFTAASHFGEENP
jgi:parallel beta-helix repeat protein